MDAVLLNGLTLAYIGDAVYEIYIRQYALNLNLTKVNDLHKKAIQYTNASFQAKAIHYLIDNHFLEEDEIKIYKRGRNSHVHTARKNVDLSEYLDATGFEALIGYLYLNDQKNRLEKIIEISIDLD